MNIYFDTEFTGLAPNTTLISIGMVTDDNKKFYAEFSDYNKSLCDEWINENVIAHLHEMWNNNGNANITYSGPNFIMTKEMDHDKILVYGNSIFIKSKLAKWLDEVSNGETIQLVSDVCHYDMTLLCNLFGGAFNLPKNINPVCYDICQDLWAFLEEDYDDLSKRMNISFDISREELISTINLSDLNKPKGIKHNSLYDAEVIRYLYKSLIGD